LLTPAAKTDGEFEAASLSHVKINANIQNKTLSTLQPRWVLAAVNCWRFFLPKFPPRFFLIDIIIRLFFDLSVS